MSADEIDDAFYSFGQRRGFHVKEMRPRYVNMRQRLVHIEKLQPMLRELLAENSRDLQGEPSLFVPHETQKTRQLRASQFLRGNAIERVGLDRLDDVILVNFAEMFFD